jgi:hypothetical protein
MGLTSPNVSYVLQDPYGHMHISTGLFNKHQNVKENYFELFVDLLNVLSQLPTLLHDLE